MVSRFLWLVRCGLGCYLGGDYLWRQEKHINRESYILLIGRYRVSMLVDISCTPLFLEV